MMSAAKVLWSNRLQLGSLGTEFWRTHGVALEVDNHFLPHCCSMLAHSVIIKRFWGIFSWSGPVLDSHERLRWSLLLKD